MTPAPDVLIAIRKAAGLTGAAVMVREQIRHLVTSGWRVHLCAERLDPAWAENLGIGVSRLPAPWWRRARIRDRFDAWAGAEIRRLRPALVVGHGDLAQQDVLHLHNTVHRAEELLRGRPLPPDDALGRHHAWQLARPGLRVIANSSLMAQDLATRYAIPADRVRVIHPGYDPARFHPVDAATRRAARRTLGLPEDRPVIGLVASGDLHKRGLDFLVAALARLPAPWSTQVHALVVAKPREAQAYALASAGVPITVVPPRPDIEVVYRALDLLVAPARYEEFGMCVLEGAAMGLPLVVSATTGAAEVVAGPGATILDDLGPDALAAAIATRLTTPGAAADVTPLAWEHHGRRVADFYAAVLGRSRPQVS